MESYCWAKGKDAQLGRGQPAPFSSCRHSEDRPRPFIGNLTSSPIQDVSPLCTDPANETLRTAERERAMTYCTSLEKYKFNRSKMNHHRQNLKNITQISVLLVRATEQWRQIEADGITDNTVCVSTLGKLCFTVLSIQTSGSVKTTCCLHQG